MPCNAVDSEKLIVAVREQADAVEDLGGFDSSADCDQFTRDARDVARKLFIAEQIISTNFLTTVYRKALRTGEIGEPR